MHMRGIRRALLATLGALAISIGGLTLPNSGAAWADEPEETIIIVELGTTQEEIDAAGLDLDVAEAKLAIPSLDWRGGRWRVQDPRTAAGLHQRHFVQRVLWGRAQPERKDAQPEPRFVEPHLMLGDRAVRQPSQRKELEFLLRLARHRLLQVDHPSHLLPWMVLR
ncbi:hypothetical protein V2I01_19445 [Micromonospora sp. BRA006-A]|nr:hypothetical protein [Micromonospora sp. BRA006-A]